MELIERRRALSEVGRLSRIYPVVAVLGPRQCGKTTLARQFLKLSPLARNSAFFDLEDETDLARLETPKLALENLRGIVIIDEIQRRPNLFETLRVLSDRRPIPARFLILGSASRDLIRQGSESLAGRIGFVELSPFTAEEVPEKALRRLWLRGGYPKSFLARKDEESAQWRKDYISTFLERDIPALGFRVPASSLRRFWTMLAHYHGQTFNASEIGQSLGLSDDSMRRYLDILCGAFMLRSLPPWHENLKKRQVKAPKIYFRDSGIFHSLIGCRAEKDVMSHPKLGASWEGWVIEEVIRASSADTGEAYFWATHNQAELDLLLIKNNRRLGYEIKYTDSPRLTPSMKIAMRDLRLDELLLIFPGKQSFPLADKIRAVGFQEFLRSIPHPPAISRR